MEEEIRHYKLIFDDNNFVIGFYTVLDEMDADFNGDVPEDLENGWYRFIKGEFFVDEERKAEIIKEREEEAKKPTWEDIIESQVFSTAMETDTLIEE